MSYLRYYKMQDFTFANSVAIRGICTKGTIAALTAENLS